MSPNVDTPLTFGWRRPVVVIPSTIAVAGGEALRYCLAHEWWHIERGDFLAWQGLVLPVRALVSAAVLDAAARAAHLPGHYCRQPFDGERGAAVGIFRAAGKFRGIAKRRRAAAVRWRCSIIPANSCGELPCCSCGRSHLRSNVLVDVFPGRRGLAAVACVLFSGVRLDAARRDDKGQEPTEARSNPARSSQPPQRTTATPASRPARKQRPNGSPAKRQRAHAARGSAGTTDLSLHGGR